MRILRHTLAWAVFLSLSGCQATTRSADAPVPGPDPLVTPHVHTVEINNIGGVGVEVRRDWTVLDVVRPQTTQTLQILAQPGETVRLTLQAEGWGRFQGVTLGPDVTEVTRVIFPTRSRRGQ